MTSNQPNNNTERDMLNRQYPVTLLQTAPETYGLRESTGNTLMLLIT